MKLCNGNGAISQWQSIRCHAFSLACFSYKARLVMVVRRLICSLNSTDSLRSLLDRHRQLLMSVLCSVVMPRGIRIEGDFKFCRGLSCFRKQIARICWCCCSSWSGSLCQSCRKFWAASHWPPCSCCSCSSSIFRTTLGLTAYSLKSCWYELLKCTNFAMLKHFTDKEC